MSESILRVNADDIPLMHAMNRLYGEAFNDHDTYCARPPTAEIGIFGYGKNDHVVLVDAVGVDS